LLDSLLQEQVDNCKSFKNILRPRAIDREQRQLVNTE